MFLNKEGEIILTTDDLLTNLATDRLELRQVGYEQAACNSEGYVDFEDAIRILIERNYMDGKTKYSATSLRLYAAMMKTYCRKEWYEEFPEGRAS